MKEISYKKVKRMFREYEYWQLEKRYTLLELEALENTKLTRSASINDNVKGYTEYTLVDYMAKKEGLLSKLYDNDLKILYFNKCLDVLSNKDRTILFGLYGKNKRAAIDIAIELNISRTAVFNSANRSIRICHSIMNSLTKY